MSAPLDTSLSDIGREVLRALLYGLELRQVGGEWRFVGFGQDHRSSGLDSETVATLLRSGLISCGKDGRAAITEDGEATLFRWTKGVIDYVLN